MLEDGITTTFSATVLDCGSDQGHLKTADFISLFFVFCIYRVNKEDMSERSERVGLYITRNTLVLT
jgi:hypothetical protein